MATDPHSELAQFQQFVGQHVQSGTQLSPEEVLDLWRLEHPDPEDFGDPEIHEDDLEAIREAIAELEAGAPTYTIEEVVAEIRRRHGISEGE